jgi:hypothetical protein
VRGRIIAVAVVSIVIAFAVLLPRVTAQSQAEMRAGIVTGVVVDDATGAPVGGATVVVSGTTPVAGATPPPADAATFPSTTTRADGWFAVTGVAPTSWSVDFGTLGPGHPRIAHAQWIEVFPRDRHAAYHAVRTVAPAGVTDVGVVALAQPSAADDAWLARINGDRRARDPAAAPLIFDSVTLQTARYWARLMATHAFFDHYCPAELSDCISFWKFETERGSPPSAQNLAYGFADWRGAQSGFMGEVARCPQPDGWERCAFDEKTGHFVNIMRASNWAGVAVAFGPPLADDAHAGDAPKSAAYFAENFATPHALGAP